LALDVRPAPFVTGGGLYARYLAGDAAVAALFSHPPAGLLSHPAAAPAGSAGSAGFADPARPADPASSAGSAARRALAVDREYRGNRADLAAALAALNARLGAPPQAVAAALALAEPGSLAVVSGQQAGLLGGPLYTLYKAAGAVALARQLRQALGRAVVPVFWAATEDHDLAEADHTWLLGRDERWRRLRYRPTTPVAGWSVGAVPLATAEVESVVAELSALLPDGLAAREAIGLARQCAAGAATYGEWFCRLMAALFGEHGLVVLDPMEPALRRLAAPGVAALLANPAGLARGLADGADAVRALGHEPQIEAHAEGGSGASGAHLFWYPEGTAGPRVALERILPSHSALAAEQPERFSGSVVTRPLLQDTVLPVVAYVAGPGEVAYYAMLRGCYEAIGLSMPLIWPRPAYTIVEPAIGHLLHKHGLAAPCLPGDLDAAALDITRRADTVGIDAMFDGAAGAVRGLYATIVPALAGVEDVLGRLAAQNGERVRRELEWLRRKAWQVARQRSAIQLGQVERIRNHLWPRRGPQERTAGVIGLLARYGAGAGGIVSDLVALDPGPPHLHRYLILR
jgi:bacillithiol biosynthesis cysteine-adding enzyme BshC